MDDVIAQATDGNSNLAVHAAYPASGPTAGPFPVVVLGHGFQLPVTQYRSYLTHLASFGYVALTVDFPTSFFGNDNPKNAHDLMAGITWAQGQASLHADGNNAGMSGHSLGGKTALLAATLDPRVKAAFALDPVDGGGGITGCNPPSCVDVSMLMPSLQIPTGFLGETTDASAALGQACAPAANNFATFYAVTNTPSVQITAVGANHMSFLDDGATCGLPCSLCNAATADAAAVHSMSQALMVAFYERHLRGNTAYDAYLTGAQAQARYVATSQAAIVSK
jgi:chlorophyllase